MVICPIRRSPEPKSFGGDRNVFGSDPGSDRGGRFESPFPYELTLAGAMMLSISGTSRLCCKELAFPRRNPTHGVS